MNKLCFPSKIGVKRVLGTISRQGTAQKCDFYEGMSQVSVYVKVRRNSKYYVVSVLGVMLGMSSLVFTAPRT